MKMLSNAEAVCTFTASGYEQFAKRFLDSWRWMPIHCYEEPLLGCRTEEWIHEYDLESESPQLVQFKKDYPQANGRKGNVYSYIFDAIKWSHRIFALAAQARRSKAELLINVDADLFVFDAPPDGFVEELLGDADIAYMPRAHLYSECSFVIYRIGNEQVRQFIDDQENAYVRGGIFGLRKGWTDCHVFDVLVQIYRQRGLKFRDINEGVPDSMHPFVNGPLGMYMDNLKGNRKAEGRSRPTDLVVQRTEEYWNQAS